ncbi:aldehyde dehydrogenase family protein [Algoriphagus mannitolivorans]|uniref:aldehyde dehydrogenase family protein n=1 Tax=Algoriphagus mannitolivorans TaxID=226504 RepID=UPI000429A0F0|nr:aldehyde dehydrogenase family protein [Algoriphagus mannitolivorans]
MKTLLKEFSDIYEIFDLQRFTANQWRTSTKKERSDRIQKLENWISSHRKEIQNALWEDFKKPPLETDFSEIYPVTSEINHNLKNLGKWMKAKSVSTPVNMLGTKSIIIPEPKGTSLIISPWNYPFNLAIGPLVSALAAGCTAIIKPSELTSATSALIEKMIGELFKPEEVCVMNGGVEVAQALLELPFDHIFFTGSPKVGKIVMENASKNLSSVTLELGGKSPTIITKSANVSDAARKIAFGKFVNCGQTCVAPDYILVHKDQYEPLIAELKLAIRDMYDPNHKGIENSKDLARIIDPRHFARIKGLLQDALEKGAKLEFGGGSVENERYLEPTIVTGIKSDMEIFEEEIFGPILPIIPFDTIQECITLINSKPKPLALYIFDQEKEHQEILQKTSSGNVVINDCVLHFLHQNIPFGGVGNSGLGKTHGHAGFLAFTHEKGVLKQRIGLNNVSLLRPPYGNVAKKIVDSLIKWL